MIPLAVTLVIEPPTLPVVGLYEPARKTSSYDEFASALSAALGVDIAIVEDSVSAVAATTGGLLLVHPGEAFFHYLDTSEGVTTRSRVFLLDANRTHVLNTLDRFGLVGAIETYRYFRWQTERGSEFGGQIYGKRALVEKLGAPISEAFSNERYALFDAPGTPDLPSALAWYLRQYSQARETA